MKLRLSMLITGACIVAYSLLAQTPKPAPLPTDCDHLGVQMHTYVGTAAQVVQGLGQLPAELARTRVFAMIVEAGQESEARFFEADGKTGFQLSSWSRGNVGDLRQRMDEILLKTRGLSCAGVEMKNMLTERNFPVSVTRVSAPRSLQSAFAPMLSKYEGRVIRVTVLDPCIKSTATLVSNTAD